MKILIADDHPLVRAGIRSTLEALPYVESTTSVETHQEVLETVRDESWDLVVMDLDMPDGDALNTLAQLGARHPDLPILVVSVHPEDSLAVRVLRAGAAGYLHKSAAVDHLAEAVGRIRNGRRYVSGELAEQMLRVLQGDADEPHAVLSDREMQVLRALANGANVTEVADRLNLSPKTISTYRARVFDKLGFENIAELVRYAVDHQLVE